MQRAAAVWRSQVISTGSGSRSSHYINHLVLQQYATLWWIWDLVPIQSAYEVLLKASLHAIDQEVHDSLGDSVLQIFAHNVKVGFHQQPCDLHLDLFLFTYPSWHP